MSVNSPISTKENKQCSPHHVKSPSDKQMRRSPDVAECSMAEGPLQSGGSFTDAKSEMFVAGASQNVTELVTPEIKEKECVEVGKSLITEDMIREEEALRKESEEEEKRLLQEAAEQELEKEEQEKRLRRLKHLLTQSEFYASFIHEKLKKHKKQNETSGDSQQTDFQGSSSSGGKNKKKGKGKSKPKQDLLAKDKELLDKCSPSPAMQVSLPEQVETTRTTQSGLVVSTRQPMLLEGGAMRDYQLEGYEWLQCLYLNGVNGILADEMGLGKTIQCIAFICYMVEQGLKGPFLIIGPLSTLSNWISEFERFAPKIPVVLYHGSQGERKEMWDKMLKCKIVPKYGKVYPVVITSYEIAMKDLHPLQDRKWEMIVIDEGHRIKNFKCKLVKELKRYESKTRLLLTGTPLQNNLTELWSLLNYLIPEIFSELSVFESWFQATDLSSVEGDHEAASKRIVQLEERDNVVSTLHRILHPFMLRRVKTDVELNIPPKKELLVFTPLTSLQDELYRAILNKTIHTLLQPKQEVKVQEEDDQPKKKRHRTCTQGNKLYNLDDIDEEQWEKLLQEEMAFYEESLEVYKTKASDLRSQTLAQGYLMSINACSPMIDSRKVVNHPYLLRFPVAPGTEELLINEELITSSGKMMVLDAMLAKLKQQGHKVLIFSQLVAMLDLIEEFMILRRHSYCRLDGSRSVIDRQQNINKFNTDSSMFAFLVSTRAGGLGINLTSADTVIIYDSDWNPQCDLQAQDRCHRIGQTRPVVVYRLTTDGTIDRRMVERATCKRRLEKIVIKKGRFQGGRCALGTEGSGISAQELLELLNSKDYVKSVTSNGYVYSDDELEVLLDRSDLMKGHQVPTVPAKEASHLYEVL